MAPDELVNVIVADNPQLRDGSARALLLGAAIRRLIDGDEASIRVLDVSNEISMSPSVIYSNFGSRQGLIDAAYLEIYRSVTAASYRDIDEIASSFDATALAARWSPGFDTEERLHRQAVRRRVRLRVLAAAITRRRLQRDVVREREAYQASLTSMFADLQRRGVLVTTLSARQLAVVHEGLDLVRAIDETMPTPLSADEWNEVKRVVFEVNATQP